MSVIEEFRLKISKMTPQEFFDFYYPEISQEFFEDHREEIKLRFEDKTGKILLPVHIEYGYIQPEEIYTRILDHPTSFFFGSKGQIFHGVCCAYYHLLSANDYLENESLGLDKACDWEKGEINE
jgi:hypothetical protein